MTTSQRWLFLREAGVGFGVLWSCGVRPLVAGATALIVAFLSVLVRSALRRVRGRRSLLSSLSDGFALLGGLLTAAGWTLFFVRKAVERGAAEAGPELLLIYGAGLVCALFAGSFFGAMAMVFLGPVVAFPYHVVRSLFGPEGDEPRGGKRSRSKSHQSSPRSESRRGSRSRKSGSGRRGPPTAGPSAPHCDNPGSSLAFE